MYTLSMHTALYILSGPAQHMCCMRMPLGGLQRQCWLKSLMAL